MRHKIIILLACVIIPIVIYNACNLFIVKLIETVITDIVGAPTSVGSFSLNIFKQSAAITDFKIYNPAGFPRDVMVDIPTVSISCEISDIFYGKIHIKELVLDLNEVTLVKNKDGKRNVENLKFMDSQKKKEPQKKPLPIRFDIVNLAIGHVITKDYSVSGPPAITAYDVNIKKSYKNISSIQQLSALIIAEPLKAAGIKGLSVYGLSILTGVAILPVATAFILTGKDYTQENIKVPFNKAFELGKSTLKEMGSIINEDRTAGTISAQVRMAHVTLKLKRITENTTQITISARKFMIPQPSIASGIMYQIMRSAR